MNLTIKKEKKNDPVYTYVFNVQCDSVTSATSWIKRNRKTKNHTQWKAKEKESKCGDMNDNTVYFMHCNQM